MKTIKVNTLGDLKNVIGNVPLSVLTIMMNLHQGKSVITEDINGEKIKIVTG